MANYPRKKSIYSVVFEDFIKNNKFQKSYVANILNISITAAGNLLKQDNQHKKTYASKVILYNFLSGHKIFLWETMQEIQSEYTHSHINEYDLTDIWTALLNKYNLSLRFVARLMHMDVKMVYRKGIIRKGRNSRNKITEIKDVNLLRYRYFEYLKSQLKTVDIELMKLNFKVF
jgi:hypothetical protein